MIDTSQWNRHIKKYQHVLAWAVQLTLNKHIDDFAWLYLAIADYSFLDTLIQ